MWIQSIKLLCKTLFFRKLSAILKLYLVEGDNKCMYIEHDYATRQIKDVASTMAIEDMYLSKEFILKMVEVARGNLSSEQLRQEVISKYARP
jgi:hypothetical protein